MLDFMGWMIGIIAVVAWSRGIAMRHLKSLYFPAVIVLIYITFIISASNDMEAVNDMGYVVLIGAAFNVAYGAIAKDKDGDFSPASIRQMGYAMFAIGFLMLTVI